MHSIENHPSETPVRHAQCNPIILQPRVIHHPHVRFFPLLYSSSSHVQSSYHPSGRYRRTTKGIFFSWSSLIAICRGSVAPSMSTRTGAFMLPNQTPHQHTTLHNFPSAIIKPYLICSALVPNTLAFSYLVIYGVVVLFSLAIFFSLSPTTAFFFPPPLPPAGASPTATILSSLAAPLVLGSSGF